MLRIVLFLTLALGALSGPVMAQDRAAIESQYRDWLETFVRPQAEAKGVSRKIFEAAFSGVTLNWDLSGLVFPGMEPEPPVQQSQAEFRAPARYFKPSALAGTAAIGRKVAAQHNNTLAAVEKASGVPGRIVLAIWARESGYGRVPITYNAFQVLGSRAYASTGDYLTNELIAALEIAQAGHVPVNAMKSSWAGALGQPQFMPASYLAYASDGDGDGRADIWGSDADTMASIANFLAVHEWDAARDWGFEVQVPDTISCTLEGPDQGRPVAAWEAMGIKRLSGKSFPQAEQKGESFLLMPAGRLGPAFIVTPNFYVLKRYNRSDLYALYVGNLGDRIQYGMGDFLAGWDGLDKIFRSDISEIQRGLESLGHDVGGADGLPGFKTRRAVGRWQEATNRTATCFPEASMRDALAE
ncbi:MAG: lytic murein transglycosylase [Paracoccaceae bacterium]